MKNTEYRISHYNTCKWPRGIIVNHVKHNKPCKNTTQAGTNHKILLNSFFYTKILTFITFFFTKNTFSLSFYFPNCTILKYDKNTRIRVQYSSIFFCTSIVDNTVAKFKWSALESVEFESVTVYWVWDWWRDVWCKSWSQIMQMGDYIIMYLSVTSF
jgi:hypothetical protein